MIVSRTHSEPKSLSSDEQMLLVYDDLRHLARRYVRRDQAGVTLGATGLVHEAWLKIRQTFGDDSGRTFSERDYYAILAQAMRRILIDRARKKKSNRYGGEMVRVVLQEDETASPSDDSDFIAFNQALDRLEAESPIHAEILFLKYFADRTNEQVGEILQRSPHWVRRQWTYARARILYFMDSD
jgi:RNA polymerase sigma factor (TIGR02999 family)